MEFRLDWNEAKQVITISNYPVADGYVAAFDVNARANKAADPKASQTYEWLADRLYTLAAQIAEVPESRGKLRKRADVEILAELIEEAPNAAGRQ